MAFMLSPGVNVSEIDLTTIVPAVGTTEGAYVGSFDWGPANQIVSVTNELELVDRFGKPSTNTFISFFTAANFLSYARNLRLIRAANTTSDFNATSNSSVSLSIPNRDSYEQTYLNAVSNTNTTTAAARYIGPLGDSLKYSICANTSLFTTWAYKSQFNGEPGTSNYAAGLNGANDEIHIIVIDEDGKFTGTANTVLEKFSYLSKASDAKKDDGSSNYYVNVINEQSRYIYITGHPASSNWGMTAANTQFNSGTIAANGVSMVGGSYGTPSDGIIQIQYDKFKNADEVDVSLIMTGNHSVAVIQHTIDHLAEFRKDCVTFFSPASANVVNQLASDAATNVVAYKNLVGRSSSYAFMDSGWKYQFDKYNNTYRWVPLNGDIAGLCVRTDYERDPWYSPAGYNRGQIKNAVKLAWSPNKSQRDDLYKVGINPVVSFQGEGTILFGDKTLLSKPSAFDRINVRRLFIVLEKAIARASKYSLFEFNDEFTRAQFVALVEPYLRDVQGRRGIYDFRVVCDTTNNTPEVIDRNEFIGDIYIKPARSINFIQLNFVAVRTGVAFEEVVGRF